LPSICAPDPRHDRLHAERYKLRYRLADLDTERADILDRLRQVEHELATDHQED
jgi:hypothetical protein